MTRLNRRLSTPSTFYYFSKPPRLTPKNLLYSYLATEHDWAVLRRAVRLAARIAHTEPLKELLIATETSPHLDNNRDLSYDAELDRIIRERLETTYHPTSTARMAPKESGGVVDSSLKVYGVDCLRVVDASIFPTITR